VLGFFGTSNKTQPRFKSLSLYKIAGRECMRRDRTHLQIWVARRRGPHPQAPGSGLGGWEEPRMGMSRDRTRPNAQEFA